MIRIEIETGNAAFGDDPLLEVARIFTTLSERLRRLEWAGEPANLFLTDSNGNKVGKVVIE